MKTRPLLLSGLRRWLAMLTGYLAGGLVATFAAQPNAQPNPQGGWPNWPRESPALDVKVVGNYIYVALGKGGLQVIHVDESQPSSLMHVGGFDTSGKAVGVAVSGNYAYVADAEAGLQVIDVSDPTNCVRVGGQPSSDYAFAVAVSGNYAYVADRSAGLQVFDVRNPANCVRVGGYNIKGQEAIGIAVSGNYAYIAYMHAGLQIIDVSDRANCRRVGECATSAIAYGVAVSGNYAYVAANLAGLQVIDVRNPASCRIVGGYAVKGVTVHLPPRGGVDTVGDLDSQFNTPVASGVAVLRNYVFLAYGNAGLEVIDVSNPTKCVRVGGYKRPGEARNVAVSERFAHFANGAGGVVTINLEPLGVRPRAEPAAPAVAAVDPVPVAEDTGLLATTPAGSSSATRRLHWVKLATMAFVVVVAIGVLALVLYRRISRRSTLHSTQTPPLGPHGGDGRPPQIFR